MLQMHGSGRVTAETPHNSTHQSTLATDLTARSMIGMFFLILPCTRIIMVDSKSTICTEATVLLDTFFFEDEHALEISRRPASCRAHACALSCSREMLMIQDVVSGSTQLRKLRKRHENGSSRPHTTEVNIYEGEVRNRLIDRSVL